MAIRQPGRRGGLLALTIAALGALAFGVGAADAAAYACTNSSADQAALQALINAGGTITITGTCRGNWLAGPANFAIVAGLPGATLNGNAAGVVLEVTGGKTATLTGITVTNGNSSVGAGILAIGSGSTVNVDSSTVTGNHASDGGGIGVLGAATVNLNQSTISSNTATSDGGGVFVEFSSLGASSSKLTMNSAILGGGAVFIDSTASLDSSAFTRNSAFAGGGFYSDAFSLGDSVTLTNSNIDHNTLTFASGGGGGIINRSDGAASSVSLVHTSVSFNLALHGSTRGGGIFNDGNFGSLASISATAGSTFQGDQATNEGGAIYTEANGGPADVSLTDTTVGSSGGSLNGNKAAYGGGIYNDAFNGLTIVDLDKGGLVAGNSASVTGGGIDNGGGVVTIAGGAVLLNHPNNCVGC